MISPTSEFYSWITEHARDDCSSLRLKCASKKNDAIDYAAAITQIECRRKFAGKFAKTFEEFPGFYFPSLLAGEQASSDLLAAYHASMVPDGATVVDFTAGLGIDAFHLARKSSSVTAIELDVDRAEALRYNAEGLHLENVEVVEGDCREFISGAIAEGKIFDVAFIDPARRDDAGHRIFALSDCRPNVVSMLPEISQISKRLIIKASPMLDISHSIESVGNHLRRAIAIGTPTDCKELLLDVDFTRNTDEPIVEAVVISGENILSYNYLRSNENSAPMPPVVEAVGQGEYVYEAYPEIMKTGVFRLLAADYCLGIVSANTKLFFSQSPVDSFPGHRYRIAAVFPFASKVIKRFKKEYPKVNVAVRNFGMSADVLRSRLGVSDGGNLRLYGFTDSKGNRVLALTEPG